MTTYRPGDVNSSLSLCSHLPTPVPIHLPAVHNGLVSPEGTGEVGRERVGERDNTKRGIVLYQEIVYYMKQRREESNLIHETFLFV